MLFRSYTHASLPATIINYYTSLFCLGCVFVFFLLDVSISVVSFFLAVLAPQCTQLEKPRLSLKGKGGRLESRKGAIRNATAESSVNVASFAG